MGQDNSDIVFQELKVFQRTHHSKLVAKTFTSKELCANALIPENSDNRVVKENNEEQTLRATKSQLMQNANCQYEYMSLKKIQSIISLCNLPQCLDE